ncbi:prepilin-type N-terminal cleavage/methylation domain-containing protein [Mesorhizobium sp. AR07]|uniref:PulJ/GspJ family protein n=1 Tax=Mesorhizobium sp. AR07 TaxID=2865838 RepID=UPI00215FC008|nr:prepilin-type N-terminal cleavage/methylation domain-containing protein [Mesorhizobium sp. AR07]UVK46534.1 prepilin-type N-terminal cleavage/methylation domain-containing protein [Mesorhizobium sp. AR07]
MTGPSSQPSPEDGFSILEMIVAMTILALVLGIASQSIVLASRSITAAKRQVEAARTVRAMLTDYEAQVQSTTQSGWTLKTRTIGVAKAKVTAVIIEKAGGAFPGGPFLTFVPVQGKAAAP